MKEFLLIIIVATVLVALVGRATSSFPNFLCPALTNPKVFYPCEKDCQMTHGALGGKCGDPAKGDYNCYCGRVRKNKPPGTRPSVQCQEKTNAWTRVCEKDCQCNHAGAGGICHWKTKVCECWGNEPLNGECEFKTAADFAAWTIKVAGKDTPSGQVGEAYLRLYGSA